MNRRIIINADDCGISQQVNTEIKKCIEQGKITSTTIMANGADFEGAVYLYKQYNKVISFGWHLNLDEGLALTRSQLLLDKGFFIEQDNKIYLNGSSFGSSIFNKEMSLEIKKELREQYIKLRDNGIEVTHADSHHFFHTHFSMVRIIPSILKELNIYRCRQISNYGIGGINGLVRQFWTNYFKSKGLRMPDTFCFFKDYYNNSMLKQGESIELMIHPGHLKYPYKEEYELMLKTDYDKNWPTVKLITYKDI